MIYGSNVFGDSEYSNHAEFFLPLDDLIDQYMPNLKAAFEADPDFRNICLAADGKIYTLPKNLPCRPNVGLQFFLNRDWLDRLGLEMPDTLDELTEVLRAFKNEDANGNGDPNDEIPVSFTDFGGVYTLLQHMGIMGDANATSTNSYTMDKNGVATFMPVSYTHLTPRFASRCCRWFCRRPDTRPALRRAYRLRSAAPFAYRAGFCALWL